MANPGEYDISEILIHHIDHIDAQLELLKSIVYPNSRFSEALKSKQGGNFISFLQQYDSAINSRSSAPKMSDSIKSFPVEFLDQLATAVVIIDDLFNWILVARTQLQTVNDHTLDLDIRWNNNLAIHVCKVFVALTKLCLFFHYFPSCRIIVLMIEHYDKLKNQRLTRPLPELIRFMTNVTSSPFESIKMTLKPLSHKLSTLVSLIGPFMIQIFGPWPIVNWQQYMIFDRPVQTIESTLPSLHQMILINLPTLWETIFLYTFVFPNFVIKHPQFLSLMANVFSDCPFIFLTRTHRISITQLNETFAKTGSKLPSALLANLKADCEMKDSISHIQRMKHIYSLLRDIVDISTYNEDYLPRFIYDILPLAGFAAYELKTSLIKETVNDVTAQLLSLIVELAKLFSKYQDTLSRFFLYNLTTVDLDYFNQLLNNYRDSGEEWQRKVINQLIDISGQIQQFDLEEFDNGVRYEITPLIVTIGRIFYSFNDVKTKQRASFLNTLFEHLMTILLHCKIMNSPLDAFLDICPIHQFWSFRKTLFRYTENYPGGIHTYASFITLAAFFNKDSVCLSLFSAEERQINDFINKSRASLLTSVQNMLAEYLKPESKIFQIVNQNRFSKVFNQSEFIKYRLVSQDGKPSDAEYREKIWQLKELMRMLPGSISTGTGNLSIADYIANNLTNHMNLILFNQLTATPDWVDGAFSSATQILWPLYTLLGESFPRKLMECRFENSTYDNQTSYLELIASIRDGDKLLEENGAKKKIIEMFQSRLNQFITTDYVKTVYRPYGKCFDNLGKLEYQADEFFSESGFKYLIASLGLHSGFILDRLLINKAANSMHRIFKIYESLSSQMNAWYSDFRESGTAWFAAQNENAIVVASNEMIHLGVILMTRRLLRETMSESAKISIPGLMPILTAAFIRNPELLSQKEELIDEVISGRNSFKLIEVALSTKEIQQTSDPIQFFFFLAVIMINPQFDDIKYSPDNEVLTYNLHLIPTAVDAFINLLKCFCTSNDTKIISTGMQFYFSVLQRIVQKKRTDLANQSSKSSSSKLSSSSINALIILADLFPKYVKCIEYGRIGINFPYSVITEAYREVESQYASLQNRLDRKKGGK